MAEDRSETPESILAQWVPPGAPAGELEAIKLAVMVRKDGSKVGISLFAPALEDDEIGEVQAILALPAADALRLASTILGGLDKTGGRPAVDAMLAAREKSLAHGSAAGVSVAPGVTVSVMNAPIYELIEVMAFRQEGIVAVYLGDAGADSLTETKARWQMSRECASEVAARLLDEIGRIDEARAEQSGR